MARDISANTEMQRRIEEFFSITKEESEIDVELVSPMNETGVDTEMDTEEPAPPPEDEAGPASDLGLEEDEVAPPEDQAEEPLVEDEVEEVSRSPDLTEGDAQPLEGSGAVARTSGSFMFAMLILAKASSVLLQ